VPEQRSILHVDMDAFFAAIEQLDDPKTARESLCWWGRTICGVLVATASYEARPVGLSFGPAHGGGEAALSAGDRS
jgi:DNA polymerase-4